MKTIFNFLKKHIEWVIFISIAFSFVSPLLFTQNWTGIDFTKTGAIGDTIGGLVSPFLNLLSIILLYVTLMEQIESTKQRNDFDSVSTLLNTVKNDFENLELTIKNSQEEKDFKGIRAMFELAIILKSSNNISLHINESSIRAFSLSFTFLLGNVNRLLQKNYSSAVSNHEKKDIYNTLERFKSPIFMIFDNSTAYIQKVNESKRTMNETDKIIQLLPIIKQKLLQEFENCKP